MINEENIAKYLKLFEIDSLDTINEEYIHKKYKKLALKMHPDKGGTNEDFQELQEGYDTLLILYKLKQNNEENFDFHSLLNNVYKFQTKYHEPLNNILNLLKNKFSNFSVNYLETLDVNNISILYVFLQNSPVKKFVNDDILKNIEEILVKKKNKECIFKKVTIKDIFQKNVYKFVYKNETFFAPMWHSEIEFETTKGEEFSVQIIPELQDNVWINENNDLCIFLKIHFEKSLLLKDYISFYIDKYEFKFPTSQLICVKNQIIKLKNQGLWKISENNIFNVNEKGDIIINIELY